MEYKEWKGEFLRLTPSILYNFVLKPRWGIEAYYRRIYGKRKPETPEMREGTRIHEKNGYDNRQKFRKKFCLQPYKNLIIELSGIPDKIDDEGHPWEAKTLKGFGYRHEKYEAAKIQLLSYLFLMDTDYGWIDFISRQSEKSIPGFPKQVLRNDAKLFSTIRDFVRHLYSQPQITQFMGGENVTNHSRRNKHVF